MTISSCQQLEIFFNQRISNIQEQHNLDLDRFIQMYMVELCLKALRSNNIFSFDSDGEIPLAFLWGKAVKELSHFKRFKNLISLGDHSLFVAGFFSDYFNNKLIDVDYYIQMGSMAYSQASDIQEQISLDQDIKVFSLLAENFKEIVFIMSELSQEMNLTCKKDLLSLYKRWSATKSEALLKKLQAKGVVVFESEDKIIH